MVDSGQSKAIVKLDRVRNVCLFKVILPQK